MILVDGLETSVLPADDRGLAYGDGLFETMRAYNGRVPLLDFHLERLENGAAVLCIAPFDVDRIRGDVLRAARHCDDGVVKLILTRGSGGRGYAFNSNMSPRTIVQLLPLPMHASEWPRTGVRLRICETRLEGPRQLHGLKHLNRLQQVLARAEWNDEQVQEGLMRDKSGQLVEGTVSNLFIVHEDRLLTPPVGAGVAGVMRRLVFALAKDIGLAAREYAFSDAEFFSADEIFITNGIIGVCPVVSCDSSRFSVGTITRRLQDAVDTELERRACSASC